MQRLSIAHFVVAGIAAIWAAYSAFGLVQAASIIGRITEQRASMRVTSMLILAQIGDWTFLLMIHDPSLVFAGLKLRN